MRTKRAAFDLLDFNESEWQRHYHQHQSCYLEITNILQHIAQSV